MDVQHSWPCHYHARAFGRLFPERIPISLRRMPLLRRRRLVGFQDPVDDRNERSKLWPFRRLGPHIAGWRGIAAHLGDRIPAQSKDPPPRALFPSTKTNHRTAAYLRCKHPRPSLFESDFEKVRPQKWPFHAATCDRVTQSLRGQLLLRYVHLNKEAPVLQAVQTIGRILPTPILGG
jgi:hypothetical protein